jgi:hypothetical protein
VPGTEDSPVLPAGAPAPVVVHKLVLSRWQKWLGGLALALCVGMSGGALVSQQAEQRGFENLLAARHQAAVKAQAAQGAALDKKLCDIFEPIASLKAPAGPAAGNPSRVFEQELELNLSKVAPALECRK